MVIVTHQAAEAWELATRVAVLKNGQWAYQEPRPADLNQFQLAYQQLARS